MVRAIKLLSFLLSFIFFSIEHQFPFSLFNAIKHNHSVKMATAGDVSEVMDKTIGRIVYKIKGSVSANNYLSVENFVLLGPILYIQYCLLKPNIATIHLEVVTISNMSFRISLSTLYDNDAPKFLGRSLRYDNCVHQITEFHCFSLQNATPTCKWVDDFRD